LKKKGFKDIGFYLLILAILVATFSFLWRQNDSESIVYSDVLNYFEKEQVVNFTVKSDTIYAELDTNKDGKIDKSIECAIPMDWFMRDAGDLIAEQREKGIIKNENFVPDFEAPWWLMAIPYVLVVGAFFIIWIVMMNRQDGGAGRAMKFARAHTKLGSDEKKKVTFEDVAGADEEKEELSEIVDFLKDPKKFVDIGARIPKGVLLVGPPGTGKTYLAKAVAGEAGVQFLSISGSDFVELYVGVGASRVRDLFEQAKRSSPSIIFIDEIDAVGRHRGAGLGGGHDEREQTLNQLLVEMDGFGNNEGVIVMAATNRPDILDPALLRPGRFDRQVYVGLPDIKGRFEVLKIHARGKLLGSDVNLQSIAQSTSGFSPADLENLLNEAALLAARRNAGQIHMEDVEGAMLKVIMGPEKKTRVMNDHERKITAYHEAGHAIAMRTMPTQDPVQQISIIPRGRAGGFTMKRPTEDKSYDSRKGMLEDIVGLLGGRVAEALVFDDISTGASGDISEATKIARAMVTKYGMSERLGPVSFDDSNGEVFLGLDYAQHRNFSEHVAALIDDEVKRIIEASYKRCQEIMTENREKLVSVAEYLLKNETMDGATFEHIFTKGEAPSTETQVSFDEKKENE